MRSDITPAELLIDDFESIGFVEAGLLRGAGEYQGLPRLASAALTSPFAIVRSAFDHPPVSSLREQLFQERGLRDISLGAKNFRPPNGLGAVLSDAVYVLRLANEPLDLSSLRSLRPVGAIGEIPIWTLPLAQRQNPPTALFVVLLQERLLK